MACAVAQCGCASSVKHNASNHSGASQAKPGTSLAKQAAEVSFHPLSATKDQSAIEKQVLNKLQAKHYNKKTLDNKFSQQLFTAYVNDLDPSHDVLLHSDITALRKQYGNELVQQLKNGKTSALYAIFNRYEKRRLKIDRYALHTVQDHFGSLNLHSKGTLRMDRSKAMRPANLHAQHNLWRKKLVNEIIRERLHGTDTDEVQSDLVKRYQQAIRRLGQIHSSDAFSAFMRAVTHSYDPHTDYFSPERSKNFNIDMNLKLQGIGAELRMKNGFPELVRLIPGGPAAKNGKLKPTDRILGVAQGQNGHFTNVVGMRLNQTVQLIRGKAGSVVRLRVSSGSTSQTKVVTLTRAKIKLKDQAAKHRVMDVQFHGKKQKVGLITLPSFYNGAASDVKNALAQLKKANVNGVVLDLRNDGGGALGEAMKLIGLFMPSAPGVQIRGSSGRVQVLGDRSQGAFYSGPLVVLVNRLSASASEITAGALQDYGRAAVVGSQTYGKGSVQTILPLKKGELKLTEAKFYRVTGDSTQLRGVTPGIKFPSAINPKKIGESTRQNALPWDRIPPTRYPHSNAIQNVLGQLRADHKKRAHSVPGFHYLAQRIHLARQENDRKQVSLNLAKRQRRLQTVHSAQLKLANKHRKAIGKKPFSNYKSFKKHNGSSKAIKQVNTRAASGNKRPVNAFQTEAGRIVLDMNRLFANSDASVPASH